MTSTESELLNYLALLNIESETLDSIEPDKIVDDFCNKKSRRYLNIF